MEGYPQPTHLADDAEVLVFIASKNTRPSYLRVLWQMSKEHAVKVCSDPRTAGDNYGLHWTGAQIDDPEVARFIPDDGRHSSVLEELGVVVLGCYQEGGEA